MKVVHINMSRRAGGASIAASRHSEAMCKAGIDSSMLTLEDLMQGRGLRSALYRLGRWLRFKINGLYGTYGSFGFMRSGFRVDIHPLVKDADVVYLHWVDDGLLSLGSLGKLLDGGKRVYWFMHDMLPITGGCHYSMGCEKYRDACRQCPLVKRKWLPDIVTGSFRRKEKLYLEHPNLHFLAPSKWLCECGAASSLCRGHQVSHCPNVIDTSVFSPGGKAGAKSFYFGEESRKVILFGAEVVNNPYKGWNYMQECLSALDPSRYVCLVLGQKNESIDNSTPIRTVFTGRLSSTEDIVRVYRASDVFVTPTLADNFPNVLLEALSCGVPCVGFDSGGVKDLVVHSRTGYLSRRCDPADLKAGVEWVLGDEARYASLSAEARRYVLESFSYGHIKEIHKELAQ